MGRAGKKKGRRTRKQKRKVEREGEERKEGRKEGRGNSQEEGHSLEAKERGKKSKGRGGAHLAITIKYTTTSG